MVFCYFNIVNSLFFMPRIKLTFYMTLKKQTVKSRLNTAPFNGAVAVK
ncbi:hypothetical protein HMPREF1606_02592 [Escherichia coli 908522]|nr:hypothetical protein HMPREF1606_02592 [Escherichia coli 908522]